MQRIRLEIGDTLEMNNRIYTIKSVLGDGATCIVYSAEYKDNMGYSHSVNIKECYPYNMNLVRDNKCLIWESEQEKSEYLERFIQTYDTLMSWQDANETVNVFDVFGLNNTLYLVMEPNKNCVTYNKFEPENLAQILRSIKYLAACVSNYHRNGYLHLDIKPSNFLICGSNESRITLFDLDTVTSMFDIDAGKCKFYSYSDGWAAPEQKQGKINKFCPATDIYAIGAVLFEKIMGRQPNVDDIGYFAEWDFDGKLFETINPKIKRLLTNIFKKTLAASVKRRYQNTDALIKDLDKAIDLAGDKPYLLSDNVRCNGYFIGRENELEIIKNSFDSGKKAVFLHGIGGIGKTEIARKYAELYKNYYDAILFIKYDNNFTLQEKFDEINIVNCEVETEEKRKILRSLLDERTLVIIDNFDVETRESKNLKMLLDSKARVLVSSRTDFSKKLDGEKFIHIEVDSLGYNELERLFIHKARLNNVTERDRSIIKAILKLLEYHTYMTELVALQMHYSYISIEQLYQKIKPGLSSLKNSEIIETSKDEDGDEGNAFEILRELFKVFDLSYDQKQVLRNMALLNFVKMKGEVYREIINPENLNAFNKLIELGYIKKEQDYFTLHTLMYQVVVADLDVCLENCEGICKYVVSCIANYKKFSEIKGVASSKEAIQKGDFIDKILHCCVLNSSKNQDIAKQWFKTLIQCDISIINRYFFKEKDFADSLMKVLNTDEELDLIICLYSLKFLANLYRYGSESKVSELWKYLENYYSGKFYYEKICSEVCKKIDRYYVSDIYSYGSESKDLDKSFSELWKYLKNYYSGNFYYEKICSEVCKKIDRYYVSDKIIKNLYSFAPEFFEIMNWKHKRHYGIALNNSDLKNEQEAKERNFEEQRKIINYEFAIKDLNKPKVVKPSDIEDWYDTGEANSYLGLSNNECDYEDEFDEYYSELEFEVQDDFSDELIDDSVCDFVDVFDELFACDIPFNIYDVYFNVDQTDAINQLKSCQTTNYNRTKFLINIIYMILDRFEYKSDCCSHLDHNWDEIRNIYFYALEFFDDRDQRLDNDCCEVEDIEQYLLMIGCVVDVIYNKNNDFFEKISNLDAIELCETSDDYEYTKTFLYLIKICILLNKSKQVIPHMLSSVRKIWPDEQNEDFLLKLKSFYPLLEKLAKVSEIASKEEDDEKLKRNFNQVAVWCKKWKDTLTEKTFELKEDK